MRHRIGLLPFIVAMLAGCSSSSAPAPVGPTILDPASQPFGKSYADWVVAYNQWIYRFNVGDATKCLDPVKDTTGALCAQDQDAASPVFFLTGTYGTPAVRSACVVPQGKALFFPLLNSDIDNVGVPAANQQTDAQLQQTANSIVTNAVTSDLFVSVDGTVLTGLDKLSIPATKFSYDVPPEPNYYTCQGVTGITGNQGPSYAAGYWVMLSALPAGQHTIVFRSHAKSASGDFKVDVTYNLTVK